MLICSLRKKIHCVTYYNFRHTFVSHWPAWERSCVLRWFNSLVSEIVGLDSRGEDGRCRRVGTGTNSAISSDRVPDFRGAAPLLKLNCGCQMIKCGHTGPQSRLVRSWVMFWRALISGLSPSRDRSACSEMPRPHFCQLFFESLHLFLAKVSRLWSTCLSVLSSVQILAFFQYESPYQTSRYY